MEDIESHLQQTHNDRQKDNPLGECPRIEPVSAPEMEMETTEPTCKEMKEIVKQARSGSAPGPNWIPYTVYKMCA